MCRGSHRPRDTGISTRRSPTPLYTGSLAISLGGVPIDFGVAVVKMAAIGDIAEVLACVGCVGAAERDSLVLGGDMEEEQEEKEEEGFLVEHGVYSKYRICHR